MSGYTSRPGRVAAEKIFGPAPRKKRLKRSGRTTTDDSRLTAEAGAWLRSLREERGISQVDMAAALGFSHRSAVSLIESGRSYLAPHHLRAYAAALGLEPRAFVKQLLSYYAPVFYEIVLKDESLEP